MCVDDCPFCVIAALRDIVAGAGDKDNINTSWADVSHKALMIIHSSFLRTCLIMMNKYVRVKVKDYETKKKKDREN